MEEEEASMDPEEGVEEDLMVGEEEEVEVTGEDSEDPELIEDLLPTKNFLDKFVHYDKTSSRLYTSLPIFTKQLEVSFANVYFT